MPLFDFICNACGRKFEALVLGKDKPSCPHCQSIDLAKQMSTFAFKSGGGGETGGSSSSGSGCSGCAGGSCSSCH
jgi:putative FmdB family regulatory protein